MQIIYSHRIIKNRLEAVHPFAQVNLTLLLQAILTLGRMAAWTRPYGPTCSSSDGVKTPCMR